MQYTRVANDAFEKIQINAGIMVSSFTPATGAIGSIMGATTGGFSFSANPTYEDFGEEVDNVPPNTWQMKRVRCYDPAASGSFVTVSAALAGQLSGAGTVADGHIVPTHSLTAADFDDVWIVGDYSANNEGEGAGYVAIHIMHALNTGGFQWQTAKDGKGKFAFDFHGHYDLNDIDTAPYEIYIRG